MKNIKMLLPILILVPFLYIFLGEALTLINPYVRPGAYIEHRHEIPLLIAAFLSFGYMVSIYCMYKKRGITPQQWVKRVAGIVLIGVIVRVLYALILPATNDEGSYLMDSYLISVGSSPFYFSFARSPALIYPLSVFIDIFGQTLLTGRIFSIVCTVGVAYSIFLLGKYINRYDFSFLAVFIFMLFPPFIYDTVYVHTQPITLLYLLSSFYFIVSSGKSLKRLAISFVFLALSTLVREAVILYVPIWVILSLFKHGVKNSIYGLFIFAGVYLSIWSLIGIDAGFTKVYYDVFALATQRSDNTGFIQKMVTRLGMFRQNLVYFFGFFYLTLLLLTGWIIKYSKKYKLLMTVLVSLIFILILKSIPNSLVSARADNLYVFYILIASSFTALATIFLQTIEFKKDKHSSFLFFLIAFFSIPFLFYVIFYSNFQTEYWIEFMLPAALLIAYIGTKVWKPLIFIPLIPIFVLNIATAFRVVAIPQRGTYPLDNLLTVVDYLDKNNKSGTIFTGAVIIPFLSGNKLSSNISHPAIYCNCTPLSDKIIYSLYPLEDEIINNLIKDDVRTILVEKITSDVFLEKRPKIKNYILNNYEQSTIIGTENPITVYKRKELKNKVN